MLSYLKEVYNYKFAEKPNYNKLIHFLRVNLMEKNIVPTKSIFWNLEDSQCSLEKLEEEKQAVNEIFERGGRITLKKEEYDFKSRQTDEFYANKRK